MTGTAVVGSEVWVNIHNSGVGDTVVTADGTGVWEATFAGQIESDTAGYAYQPDVDGDQTQIQWPAPPPEQNVSVFVDQSMVHAYQWPVDTDVTLTVQHPAVVLEDFEDGDAVGWGGSNGTITVCDRSGQSEWWHLGRQATMNPGACSGSRSRSAIRRRTGSVSISSVEVTRRFRRVGVLAVFERG